MPPIELSLVPAHFDYFKTDRLFNGALIIKTPYGLSPLNRLLIEGTADSKAKNVLGLMLPDALPLLAFSLLRAPEVAAAPEQPVEVVQPVEEVPLETPDENAEPVVLPEVFLGGCPATYYHHDLFHVEMARETARKNHCNTLLGLCAADLPEQAEAPELILFAFGNNAETALVCEVLRQAHARLAPGGKLLAAVQKTTDTWLRNQLEKTFGNLTLVRKDKTGLLYSVKKKNAPVNAAERFCREIEVNFGGEMIKFDSSYGIFSNAGLDNGSRALLEMLEPPTPCESLLDLGCGWGALGILANKNLSLKRLTMIDANARAVDMAQRNVKRYVAGPEVHVRLECDAESILYEGAPEEVGAYDLVISNPPYATEFRVIEMFLRAAHRALRLGGTVWFVTKTNPLLEQRMREQFGNLRILSRRGYSIFTAKKTTHKPKQFKPLVVEAAD